MSIDLRDKIILITGAGGETGRSLAIELTARGAIIAAVDINPLGLDETEQRILAAGGRVKTYAFDTAKRLPILGLVDEVLDDWGRVDVLVLAAEVCPADPILTMDEWDFHRTLDVNLAGPFFLMQRVAQVMIQQGGGYIVYAMGAVSAGGAAYKASLAGLQAVMDAAVEELNGYNITVMKDDDFRLLLKE